MSSFSKKSGKNYRDMLSDDLARKITRTEDIDMYTSDVEERKQGEMIVQIFHFGSHGNKDKFLETPMN